MPTDSHAAVPDDDAEGVSAIELDAQQLVPRGYYRRRVLITAGLIVAVGVAVQLVGSCLAPPRIVEGPMVQQGGETTAAVVWYTTRDTPLVFTLTDPTGADRTVAVETADLRHVVRLGGLRAGTEYPYTISSNGRTLASATLRTSKSAGQPFRFMVLGDSGRGTQAQYHIGARIGDGRPDFVVHTGDLVYPAGERKHYRERFFQPYRRVLSEVTFWPSLGNHDDAKETLGDPYREVFELPNNGPADEPAENHYWFDYADARIVVIDSNIGEETLASRVAPWLRESLVSSSARWKFVVFHHPPYTFGKHSPDARIQRAIVPVCEEQHVDVVFCGHDHLYQRTLPLLGGEIADVSPGVVYIISGAGGASLYKEKDSSKRPAFVAALRDSVFSFTIVTIDGSQLTLTQTSADGEIIDQWSRSK